MVNPHLKSDILQGKQVLNRHWLRWNQLHFSCSCVNIVLLLYFLRLLRMQQHQNTWPPGSASTSEPLKHNFPSGCWRERCRLQSKKIHTFHKGRCQDFGFDLTSKPSDSSDKSSIKEQSSGWDTDHLHYS